MAERKIKRQGKGSRQGGQFAPEVKGKVAPSQPVAVRVQPVRASVAEKKPAWKPLLQSNKGKIGTLEYLLAQGQELTEKQALALSENSRIPSLDSSVSHIPNYAWGQAQQRAMQLLGETRYAELELKWVSKWPDFSRYSNDDVWDTAWNILANTMLALALRGDLTQKDYDVLTLPWRGTIGRVHPGDLEVTKTAKPLKQDKVLPLDILNT